MKFPISVAMKAIALSLTGVALALPSFSIAQTAMIVVPPGAATGVGLASAAQYQVLADAQWADYENVITIAVLNETTKLAANSGSAMTSAGYSSIASAVRAQLDASAPSTPLFQRMDVASRLRYGIDSLTPLASSQQESPLFPKALFEIEKAKFLQLETVVDPSRQQPADLALFATTSGALEFIADQIQQASGLAQNDPQYGAAVNIVLSALTTFDSASSYAQIQVTYGSALPTLAAPNADGSYTLSVQDLVSQYQSIVGAVQAMVNSGLAALESSNRGAAKRPFVSAKAARRLAAPQAAATGGGPDTCSVIACKVAQGAVTGISKLVGFSDPHLGAQISTVGSAAIQAGFAIDQLVTGAVTGFATFGPIGAIAGAAASIFSSIFGGSSSSADTAVLQQIQILSQQIARLQQDLDAQFAQVDATLNTILTTLIQNFALIDYELGTLNGSAVQIKNSLLDIETQLNSMEYYNLAYQQAEEADTLMLSVNGCLNYAATHNGADIGQSQFDNCENTFFTWAQTNALDAIWAPLPPNFADSGVYGFFNDFSNSGVCPSGCPTPFAATVNYLNQFPSQNLGLSPLSATTLPNPDEWTLGARLYLLMAYQWPQYAANLGVSFLDTYLIPIGASLQQAAQNVNSSRPSSGPISENPALFNALTAKYSSSVAQLQNAAYAEVNSFLSKPNSGLTNNGVTLSLWAGGANQATNLRPSIPSIKRCDNSGPALATPSNLLGYVPPLYAADQFYHNVSPGMNMCIASTSWVNEQVVWTPSDPTSCTVIPPTTDSGGGYTCSSYLCGGPVETFDPDGNPIFNCYPSEKKTDAHVAVNINLTYQGTTVTTAVAQSSIVTEEADETFVQQESCGDDGDVCLVYDPQTTTIDLNSIVNTQWTSLLNLRSALNTSSEITQVPQPELASTITAQFDSELAGFQQTVYGMIASDFNSAGAGMQTAGQLLSGDKLLLQAYTSFGLPDSLQSDDLLRGLLFGSQAIYDGPRVQADFAGFGTAPIADTTEDKITDEANAMNGGLTGLNAEINTVLAAVQTNQLPESLSQIDVTLEDLQAFANLKSASNALTACDFQVTPGFLLVGAAGGTGIIKVQEPSGCAWTATTGAPWLTISSNPSGTGSGAILYSVASDTVDSGRDGIVIIGDQFVHILQSSDTNGGGPGPGPGPGEPVTTTMSLDANPASAEAGAPIVLTATLSPYSEQGSSTNGEPVTFYNGSNSLGTAALENGTATLSNVVSLPVGTDSLTVVYAGDGTFGTSTSPPVMVDVSAPPPPAPPQISEISPNYGAPAALINITGTGFGAAPGSVTVGGAPSYIVRWSDTNIAILVPTRGSTGNLVVTVDGQASNGVSFTFYLYPAIAGVWPVSGPVGTLVTINGTGLLDGGGDGTVTFNGTPATIVSQTSTIIQVDVPAGATTGTISLHANGDTVKTLGNFTVTGGPQISEISPNYGAPAALINITGTGFGAAPGSVTVGGAPSYIVRWSDTNIAILVPTRGSTGNLVVTVDGQASNGVSFTFYLYPAIAGVWPVSGPVGTLVTINGTGLLDGGGDGTVTFNGTPATIVSQTSTIIQVDVPAGATTGPISVHANGDTVKTLGNFTVTGGPQISEISPNYGAPAALINITGTGFGAAPGSVTVGGAPSYIVRWSDTNIAILVPTRGSTGNLVVTVDGQASNGVSFTFSGTS